MLDRVAHHIVINGPLVSGRFHRMASKKLAFAKSELGILIASSVVPPSHTLWALLLRMILEKDGAIWPPRGDYHPLTVVTGFVNYPISNIHDIPQ